MRKSRNGRLLWCGLLPGLLLAACPAAASHWADACGGYYFYPIGPEPDCVSLSVDARWPDATFGPGGHVDEVRTELHDGWIACDGEDDHWLSSSKVLVSDRQPVRVADYFPLNPGPYRLCVQALRDGVVISERRIDLELRESFTVTATMSANAPLISSRSVDWTDIDGDGALGFGDLVQYRVSVTNVDDEIYDPVDSREFTVFDLMPESLVAESVSATSGYAAVATGPGGVPDPHQVVWIDDDLASGETASLFVEATLVPTPMTLETEIQVWDRTFDEFIQWVTPLEANPGIGFQTCLDDLSDVGSQLATAQSDLADAQSVIARDLGDDDGDAVVNIADDCPGSASDDVDALGCTQVQFCAQFAGTTSPCNNADWKNDEVDDPNDCHHVQRITCEPR